MLITIFKWLAFNYAVVFHIKKIITSKECCNITTAAFQNNYMHLQIFILSDYHIMYS